MSRDEGHDDASREASAAPDVPRDDGDARGDRDDRDDVAFARLRAADPAAEIGASAAGLREKVDARLAADGGATAAEGGDGTGVEDRAGDELADRRGRRRTPWLAAAGVVVLAAVGVGGYALGGAAAPGAGDAAGTADAPVVLNGGGRGAGAAGDQAAAGSAELGAAEAGAGASDAVGSSDGASTMPSWATSGRALFHADGLSTAGGTASAYAFDATGAATREGAARLAEALGVDGKPRWEYGWSVGPQDGSGPHVWLSADGSAMFGYNDPDADPWRCEEVAARTDGGDDGEDTEPSCDEPGTSTVGDREARDALTDVMRSLGVDPDTFEIEVGEKSDGDPSRWVTAYQVVDGSRTGAQWSATVGEEGVAWLDGFLATTVDLGEYPVISPAEAVERLEDPRFSGAAWPVAYADEEAMWASEPDGSEPTKAPAPPAAGGPVDWPVSDVEITDARLGLAQQAQADGSVVLVPAYELSDADGNAWSVVAVADDAMDFSAPR